jgi:hypothetical protein
MRGFCCWFGSGGGVNAFLASGSGGCGSAGGGGMGGVYGCGTVTIGTGMYVT